MAVTHPVAVRNDIADLVVDKLDLGTTNPNGRLVLNTSGGVEVATLNLANPAFGAAVAGVATAGAIADDTNATGGTTTKCILTDRDNATIIEGSVGATSSGADIELSSNVIGATDTVQISSLTYTAPL